MSERGRPLSMEIGLASELPYAVYRAKSRVLCRLRLKYGDLIE